MMTETLQDIRFSGTRLKELRGDRPRREVAEPLGITVQSLQQMENGEIKPAADTLIRMCALFGVGINELSDAV